MDTMDLILLYDYYGELLTEKQKELFDLYYNEDLSLAEIAEHAGISRQGVRDIIKKSEEDLLFYEEKLGLASKMQIATARVDELCSMARSASVPSDIQVKLEALAKLIGQ